MYIHIMNESASAAPKVSVIIPLYNKAPYIKRALDSVLAQTVQDFEVVVVNDGSTDGGEKIVEELNDSRIRLINQKNQGVSAARNNGVDAAKAELVAFLDADDEWLPEFLETILRLRERWPEAGLYGTGYRVVTTSKQSDKVVRNDLGDQIIQNWFSAKNLYGKGGMIILTSGMMIPVNVYSEIGGFPLGISQGEDRYIRARIALLYPVVYSPSICAIYHADQSTTTARFKTYQYDSFSKDVETNIDKLSHRKDWKDIREFCDGAIAGMCAGNIRSGADAKLVRKDIRKIKSNRYIFEKYSLLLISHLPKACVPISLKGYAAICLLTRYIYGLIHHY